MNTEVIARSVSRPICDIGRFALFALFAVGLAVSGTCRASGAEGRNALPRNPRHKQKAILTLPGGAKISLVYVRPGTFTMGSPGSEKGRGKKDKKETETQHRVTLTKGFWLGLHEVTQAQWESVMGENPSHFKGPELPVERVSWENCQKFIAKVNAALKCGARLPTEAEWEYAYRAGTVTTFPWGAELNGGMAEKENWNGNFPYPYGSKKGPFAGCTKPVGKYPPNPWGFYDMGGNVKEWCEDWFDYYPTKPVVDPVGVTTNDYHICRGGDWSGGAAYCRSADRCWYDPREYRTDLGFRLCCSAAQQTTQKAFTVKAPQ